MLQITPHWRKLLTNHLNSVNGIDLAESNMEFTPNGYYPQRNIVKVVDVEGIDAGINPGKQVFQYIPLDLGKYFQGVPLIYRSVEETVTGKELIEHIALAHGTVFDLEKDFTAEFLNQTFTIGDKVTVTAADTSYGYTGTFTIATFVDNYNLSRVILERNLDIYKIPDIIRDDTQSLQLILNPVVIKSKAFSKAVSKSDKFVLSGILLDELMIDIESTQMFNQEQLVELKDLLNGQTFEVYLRENEIGYSRSITPLQSEHYSGTPYFESVLVTPQDDLGELVGTIEMDKLGLDNHSYLNPLMYNYFDNLAIILERAMEVYPEKADGISIVIDAMVEHGGASIFKDWSRPFTTKDMDAHYATVSANADERGMFIGKIDLKYSLDEFFIVTEQDRDPFELESGKNINMESYRITLTEDDGELMTFNFINRRALSESVIVLLALINPWGLTEQRLKPDLLIGEGKVYREYKNRDVKNLLIREFMV